MKEAVWYFPCEGQDRQSDLILNVIIVVNLYLIIQAYKYTQQSYSLGNSELEGAEKSFMGTGNILFLDLVVVSRGAIIPEISLSYPVKTCLSANMSFIFKNTCIIKKCGRSLWKAVSVNVSHLLSVSVKEASYTEIITSTMKHQRTVTLLHTVNFLS